MLIASSLVMLWQLRIAASKTAYNYECSLHLLQAPTHPFDLLSAAVSCIFHVRITVLAYLKRVLGEQRYCL